MNLILALKGLTCSLNSSSNQNGNFPDVIVLVHSREYTNTILKEVQYSYRDEEKNQKKKNRKQIKMPL